MQNLIKNLFATYQKTHFLSMWRLFRLVSWSREMDLVAETRSLPHVRPLPSSATLCGRRLPTHTGCVVGDHQPTQGAWWELTNPHRVCGGRSPAPSRKELNYKCKTSHNHLKVKLMFRARVKTYCMNYPFFSSTILTLNTLPATTLEADNNNTKLQTFTS